MAACDRILRLIGLMTTSVAGFFLRTSANLHEADWAEEQISGISYLRFLRELAEGFEMRWPTLRAAIEQIRSLLVTRAAMLCNVTTDTA